MPPACSCQLKDFAMTGWELQQLNWRADSKTVPVARSVLTTPLARRKPPTQVLDRHLSSRGPCQPRTFKQAQTTQQAQSITKLFGTQIDKSN